MILKEMLKECEEALLDEEFESENGENEDEAKIRKPSDIEWISDEQLEIIRMDAGILSILSEYPQIKNVKIKREKRWVDILPVLDDSCDYKIRRIRFLRRKYQSYDDLFQAVKCIRAGQLIGNAEFDKAEIWNACRKAMADENRKYHISEQLAELLAKKEKMAAFFSQLHLEIPDYSSFGCLGMMKEYNQYAEEEKRIALREKQMQFQVKPGSFSYKDVIQSMVVQIHVDSRSMIFIYHPDKNTAEAVNQPNQAVLKMMEDALVYENEIADTEKKICSFPDSHPWAEYMQLQFDYTGGQSINVEIAGRMKHLRYEIPLYSKFVNTAIGNTQDMLIGLAFKESARTDRHMSESLV